MKGDGVWTIQKVGVAGAVRFAGLIGLVWGFLAGIIVFVSYLQGYLAEGNATLLQTGAAGLVLMIAYGVLGGVIGGAIIALLYNRVLGARLGIEVELAPR